MSYFEKDINQAHQGIVITFRYRGGSRSGQPRLVTILEVDEDHIYAYDNEAGEIKNFLKSKIDNYAVMAPDCREILTREMLDSELVALPLTYKINMLRNIAHVPIQRYKKIRIFRADNFGDLITLDIPRDFKTFCELIGYTPKPSKAAKEAVLNDLVRELKEKFNADVEEIRKKMGL